MLDRRWRLLACSMFSFLVSHASHLMFFFFFFSGAGRMRCAYVLSTRSSFASRDAVARVYISSNVCRYVWADLGMRCAR